MRSFPTQFVRRRLLAWFKKNSRDYPWRKTGNWFHLMMAEMMLRRTRADQVAPVYVRFTESFKRPADCARVSREKIRDMLSPLGLKWRANHMLETIDHLRDHYALRTPNHRDDLRAIPGVGEYSNAMLRNRLFDEPLPALDSNMARLICRIQGMSFTAESRRNKRVRELAMDLVDTRRSADLNLAVLDFSALVCRPRNPECTACPLRTQCRYGDRAASGQG